MSLEIRARVRIQDRMRRIQAEEVIQIRLTSSTCLLPESLHERDILCGQISLHTLYHC